MKKLLLIFPLLSCCPAFGQIISGEVFNEKTNLPIEYVNIGVIGKNTGTTSDLSGKYNITLSTQLDEDTLMFSSIGYLPFSVRVSDFKRGNSHNVFLKENVYRLREVIIQPKKFKEQTLGVTSLLKKLSAGFKDNNLGYELGILMKVKKSALLKRVNINFSACTYDSLFYRLNIYKVLGRKQFENILRSPIYLRISKDKLKEEIQVDLQSMNISVDGDFLVTLEHVKDLGKGYLYFRAGILDKTYYRKTSQGEWETAPIGISISVDAIVEK